MQRVREAKEIQCGHQKVSGGAENHDAGNAGWL
jgi:hypothetical protein